MVKYTKQQEIDMKIKKYSNRVNRKVGSLLWKEDNEFIHKMRRSIDKSELSLPITDKRIIKKLEIFCLQLDAGAFYVNGNTFISNDGRISSRYLKSFNERQKKDYGGFELKPYDNAFNFKLLKDNFSRNKHSLKNAIEAYIRIIKELKRDHRNIKRFLKLFSTLTKPEINKMSKQELISYFKRRKIGISPF